MCTQCKNFCVRECSVVKCGHAKWMNLLNKTWVDTDRGFNSNAKHATNLLTLLQHWHSVSKCSVVVCWFFMYEHHRVLSLVAARGIHMRAKFKAKATNDFKLSGLLFKRWHSEIISRTYWMGGNLDKCRVHVQTLWFWVKLKAVICATREFIWEISPQESASKVGHFICTRFGWLECSPMNIFLHALDTTWSTFKINANWIRK